MGWVLSRKIPYTHISGSCAISPDGLTVAYGLSGGTGTDGVQVIKNYGAPVEQSFFISIPGYEIGLYYGYGISLDSTGSLLGTTGVGGNLGYGPAGTGHLYSIVVASNNPNLKSTGHSIVSDSNIFAPSFVANVVATSNISASGSFGTSGQVLSQTGAGIRWISPSTLVLAVTPVTSGSYSVLASDYYIGCNGSGITILLPPGSRISRGKQYIIKDESGNALLNNVTINATSPDLIDGNSTVKLYINHMSLTLLWTGSCWSVI
jgi:hypothetical protein